MHDILLADIKQDKNDLDGNILKATNETVTGIFLICRGLLKIISGYILGKEILDPEMRLSWNVPFQFTYGCASYADKIEICSKRDVLTSFPTFKLTLDPFKKFAIGVVQPLQHLIFGNF